MGVFRCSPAAAVRPAFGIVFAETPGMQTSSLSKPQLEQHSDERDPKRGDSPQEPAPSRRPEPTQKVDEPSLPFLPIG
jgi:hypothetical protein